MTLFKTSPVGIRIIECERRYWRFRKELQECSEFFDLVSGSHNVLEGIRNLEKSLSNHNFFLNYIFFYFVTIS